ncbi:general stress protein [Pseudalkalibacillus caeni]|uniref:Low temperature-induced protein n=1 Tax=Exobacillus caeni TaxID=2574798 RepID=A0A5R9EWF4_9BACL|nr:general stress protein [Pseudalkalibacillus caeni]TLS35367.1 low temperature-induced protein [Pseudalkalibacillus caeni]
MDKRIIGGVFENQDNAIRAIEALKERGYDTEDFSVFAKSEDDVQELEDETNVELSGAEDDDNRGSNAAKGAGIGAGTGGVLGGIVGLIAEVGLLTIPGIGPIAAAGPIATTLSGAAIGAGGGSIVGALTGAGIPEDDAKEYEEYLKNGHILVLVEADAERENVVYGTFENNNTVNAHMYPEYTLDDDQLNNNRLDNDRRTL